MHVTIVTPAPRGSRSGNRVTAERWARLIRALGHRVALRQEYLTGRSDLLVALHARKSSVSVRRFHSERPGAPIVVALAGTDLYGDLRADREALESLQVASRLVVLQPCGIEALPQRFRSRARVILQSASPVTGTVRTRRDVFEVVVLGHLRPVKDPFRTALASRLLPPTSRIRVLHLGAALSPDMAERAQTEQRENHRYRWLGERPRSKGLRVLARSRLSVSSSESEGGANVLSEAIVNGVPVLASHIPGAVGILGDSYSGYFPVADTQALAAQLDRAERDPEFYAELAEHCAKIAPLFQPGHERSAWDTLIAELTDGGDTTGGLR